MRKIVVQQDNGNFFIPNPSRLKIVVRKGYNWIGSKQSAEGNCTFYSFNPKLEQDNETEFFEATLAEMDEAIILAHKAFEKFRDINPKIKLLFFKTLELHLRENKNEILSIYCNETGLSITRAEQEFDRTLFQIRQFTSILASCEWMAPSIDTEILDTRVTKSDIRKIKIGLGPIVVFGASNFPLAYSTIGGDSIAALAAGCPVIVKSHPMHAGTGALVAKVVINAALLSGLPEGVFSNLNGFTHDVGAYLVNHPLVKGVAFTGGFEGGMALFRLAAMRKNPIPVFAEMGSLNPVIIHDESLEKNGFNWARDLAESITNDGGQFCTKPGLIFIKEGKNSDEFLKLLKSEVTSKGIKTMVHPDLKSKFLIQLAELQNKLVFDVSEIASRSGVFPVLLTIGATDFLTDSIFQKEFFGPFSLVVKCKTDEELLRCIDSLEGQLTASIFVNDAFLNKPQVKQWIPILQSKAGRINFNNVPTGVRVCQSMQHGGPYPASTDSRYGAVGTDAIERFLRPVCFQNFPDALLPEALKDENPWKIKRRINEKLSFAEIIR